MNLYVHNLQRNAQLRTALEARPIAVPGAINALSAIAIEQAEFSALYLSGAVLSNSVGGVPDIGVMTLDEARAHAAAVARVTRIPIIMDADTGFGEGAGNMTRTIVELENAGVSAVHIEDQVFPKRCGHLSGKSLVDPAVFCEKIEAAVAARTDPDFMIIARTDARSVTGYDDAVERATRYVAAGADCIFPEALQGREEFERFGRDVPTLLLANMTEFGNTPYLTVDEFGDCGYNIVIFPVTLQRLMMGTAVSALAHLRKYGTQKDLVDRMQTRAELYDMLGYEAALPRGSSGDQQ
jgi:methylisocitrate lyase